MRKLDGSFLPVSSTGLVAIVATKRQAEMLLDLGSWQSCPSLKVGDGWLFTISLAMTEDAAHYGR